MSETRERAEDTETPAISAVGQAAEGTNAGADGRAKAELIAALRQNWLREREGAHTYRDLAAHEKAA